MRSVNSDIIFVSLRDTLLDFIFYDTLELLATIVVHIQTWTSNDSNVFSALLC